MSIVMQCAADGETDFMFGRRVSKAHPQVETYGMIDELTPSLGFGCFPLKIVVPTPVPTKKKEE